MHINEWVFCPKKQQDAKLRLFCFPYAGSGASVFNKWPHYFSTEIEICAIQLPGRESRFIEKPYKRITKLVERLAYNILPLLNKPFVFFGHSIGAHISFHLARHLRKYHMPCPIHMFISGARAPHILDKDPGALHYKMEDNIFIDKLIELGGMPEQVLKNRELLDLVLPILKADVEILNTIEYIEEDPLNCSLSSFGGLFDPRVSREDSEAWKQHTCREFRLIMFPGKHLFINTHPEQLISSINEDIDIYHKRPFCSQVSDNR